MSQNLAALIPGVELDELTHLNNITKELSDEQLATFTSIYGGKRQKNNTILMTALLGLVVVAGVHRFILGQIGMGLLYLFTGGFCLVGTIIDLVKHKDMVSKYNMTTANQTLQQVKLMSN